jgi:methyltransferase
MVISEAVFLGFLGALAAERCVELAISRRNAARAFAHGGFEVGQRHYRVMAAMHTVFFAACASEVLLLERPFPGFLGFVALFAVCLAQVLRYAAIWTLGERWNVRIIVWPAALPVTKGPYRFVRHPNYLAVIIEFVAVPLVHGAYLSAFVFSLCNVWILAVRIREEERALGPGYATAFRERPRFIPRPFGG